MNMVIQSLLSQLNRHFYSLQYTANQTQEAARGQQAQAIKHLFDQLELHCGYNDLRFSDLHMTYYGSQKAQTHMIPSLYPENDETVLISSMDALNQLSESLQELSESQEEPIMLPFIPYVCAVKNFFSTEEQLDLMDDLLARGCSIHDTEHPIGLKETDLAWDALCFASNRGQIDLMQGLLDRGALQNSHTEAQRPTLAGVDVSPKRQTNTDVDQSPSWDALHLAVMLRKMQSIECLLNHQKKKGLHAVGPHLLSTVMRFHQGTDCTELLDLLAPSLTDLMTPLKTSGSRESLMSLAIASGDGIVVNYLLRRQWPIDDLYPQKSLLSLENGARERGGLTTEALHSDPAQAVLISESFQAIYDRSLGWPITLSSPATAAEKLFEQARQMACDLQLNQRNEVTPLVYALIYSQAPIASILIAHGASLEQRVNGQPLLHHVAGILKNQSVVLQLLEQGADFLLLNDEGQSAADVARAKNQTDIFKTLKEFEYVVTEQEHLNAHIMSPLIKQAETAVKASDSSLQKTAQDAQSQGEPSAPAVFTPRRL